MSREKINIYYTKFRDCTLYAHGVYRVQSSAQNVFVGQISNLSSLAKQVLKGCADRLKIYPTVFAFTSVHFQQPLLVSLILILPCFPLYAEEKTGQAQITTPLVLKEGGTADNPAIFDGQGMVIDLGIDVSQHDWKREGDIWTSQPGLLGEHVQEQRIAGQTAGLFVDEIPITIPRDLEVEKSHPDRKSRCYFPPDQLQPGQMGYADDGSLYFRWPKGVAKTKPIILPPKAGTNCVSIACSHIIVRNLTAKHAGNDGFNIHGDRKGIRLENVRAFSNADEGISAHEATEMEVVGCEVAWNGSAAGGVADVNDSITSYRNCVVYNNAGAAFFFAGKSHRVADTLIYNQAKDFAVKKGTEFTQSEVRVE